MLFHLFCTDKPDSLQLRLKTRPDHLSYLESFNDHLVFGGPRFGEDGETPIGGVLIVDLEDRAAAEDFAANDPYAKVGLFQSVTIAPVKQVFPK